MNEREREIEARVNAATVGCWEWQEGLYPNRLDSLLAVDPDDDDEVEDVIYTTVAGILIKDEDAALIAAAPADIRYLLARVRELEAENAALRTNEGNAIRAYQQRDKWIWKLEEKLNEYHAALTPFAAVGAQVAARPAYPPAQTIMRVGAASFTVADLQAAAAVVGVAAEAVTGDSVGTGISEIMGDAK